MRARSTEVERGGAVRARAIASRDEAAAGVAGGPAAAAVHDAQGPHPTALGDVASDLLDDLPGRGVAGVADAGDGALGVVVADHALEGDNGAGGGVLDGVGELGDADGGLDDLGTDHTGRGSRERPAGLVGTGRHGVSSIGAAGWD